MPGQPGAQWGIFCRVDQGHDTVTISIDVVSHGWINNCTISFKIIYSVQAWRKESFRAACIQSALSFLLIALSHWSKLGLQIIQEQQSSSSRFPHLTHHGGRCQTCRYFFRSQLSYKLSNWAALIWSESLASSTIPAALCSHYTHCRLLLCHFLQLQTLAERCWQEQILNNNAGNPWVYSVMNQFMSKWQMVHYLCAIYTSMCEHVYLCASTTACVCV